MTSLRIAQLAERSGVPATTLRYYEEIGLLVPAARRPNGYRAYSQRDVERLGFITRAKRLDLSLEDLRELVTAWDSQDCRDVQERMARLVATRLAQTQDQVADLLVLAGQLQTAVTRLAGPSRAGPCDDDCACSTTPPTGGPAPTTARGTPPSGTPAGMPTAPQTPAWHGRCGEPPPIACTLDAGGVRDRLADWKPVLDRATSRGSTQSGMMLTFPMEAGLIADLARLAAAEQACCSFFDFTIVITRDGVRFEVCAPREAHDLVQALFGPSGATT